jgi:hypothetical protein
MEELALLIDEMEYNKYILQDLTPPAKDNGWKDINNSHSTSATESAADTSSNSINSSTPSNNQLEDPLNTTYDSEGATLMPYSEGATLMPYSLYAAQALPPPPPPPRPSPWELAQQERDLQSDKYKDPDENSVAEEMALERELVSGNKRLMKQFRGCVKCLLD